MGAATNPCEWGKIIDLFGYYWIFHSVFAWIRHFVKNLDLNIIWIEVLPNGSILSFSTQWPCKWFISAVLIVNAFGITLWCIWPPVWGFFYKRGSPQKWWTVQRPIQVCFITVQFHVSHCKSWFLYMKNQNFSPNGQISQQETSQIIHHIPTVLNNCSHNLIHGYCL